MPLMEVCLCGCNKSDEATRLRRERAAAAEHDRQANLAAFERYYADRAAGQPLRTPAEYLAEVRKEATDGA